MRRVKLGQICEVVSGGTPKTNVEEYWNGEFNWITPAEINDNDYIISDTKRKITQLAIEKKKLTLLPKGTILLSSRAPIGKVAIAGKEMYCNQGFKNLICSDEICNEYLYWYLKSKKEYLNSLGRGATFKEISKKIVENIEIKLPEIEQQRKIVNKLKEVDKIIQQRKCQSRLLDGMVQARFVEMFGDPITNSKLLPIEKIEERYFLKAGITTKAEDIHDYLEDKYEIPCYGGNGIRGYVENLSYEGCYPIIGRQGALCGNVQYATGKFHATEHAVLVSILKNDNTMWVYYMLKLMDLYRYHTGAAQPGLAVKKLNTIDVIVADINLQNQFATFVHQVNKSKFVIHKFLYCFIDNKQSIIKPRLNTKESGKIRGGKPHADEF